MRPFKIKLSVEWTDQDVEADASGFETTELGTEGWSTYEPDQLALAVMLAMPELVRDLTRGLTRHTGERPANDQVLEYVRRAAADGSERAAAFLRHLAEMDPAMGMAPASETTGDAPSVEELTAMWDVPMAQRGIGRPDRILIDDILPRCTICGAEYSNLIEHMRDTH